MPSWDELSHFLGRADRVTRLHDDPAVMHLHRTTTNRKAWPQVMALAFDHRRQFEDLAATHGAGTDRIIAFKDLVARAAAELPGTDIILDERFGRAALHRFGDGQRWIARPVELPGSVPLVFEPGPDLTAALRTWPSGQVAKCLVTYAADDAPELRAAQEQQLQRLQAACHANDLDWLLEVIPPARAANRDAAVCAAVERLYEIGLKPDWWKLPPMAELAAWQTIAASLRRHDPYCRGLLILGLDASEAELQKAFTVAAREPMVKGFAIGRSIFWSVAEQWFAGKLDDAGAMAEIAKRYRRVSDLWAAAGTASVPATAAR